MKRSGRFKKTGLNVLFGPKISKWKFQPDQLLYVTPYIPRLQMAKLAGQIYNDILRKPNIILWDMFGGIGSDSISFSEYFNIITTELDSKIFQILKQNVRNHGVSNVQVLNINCLLLLHTIQPDVIYFDPPWGNDFNPKEDFDFTNVTIDFLPQLENFDNVELQNYSKVSSTIVLNFILHNMTSNVIVKSPLNSNTFENLFYPYINHIYKYPKKNLKFLYLSSPKKHAS